MYKSDDKIVVKIDKLDAASLNKEDNVAFYNEQVLGKLEDFQPADKKIKMTVEEKKEFDDITDCFNTPWAILNHIAQHGSLNPNLKNHLFESGTSSEKIAAQIEFVKALEHPELIEVVKEKKYYIKILGQYLVRNSNESEGIELVSKRNADTFTPNEIAEMSNWKKFQAIDLEKCKEEVKE